MSSPSANVTVTVRCERADGQFTIAQTTVPDDLKTSARELQYHAERIVFLGFVDAYSRLKELPVNETEGAG